MWMKLKRNSVLLAVFSNTDLSSLEWMNLKTPTIIWTGLWKCHMYDCQTSTDTVEHFSVEQPSVAAKFLCHWIQLIFRTVTVVWQQSHNEMTMTRPVLHDPRQSEETEQSYILLRPLELPVLSECFIQLMKVEERSTLSFFFWCLVRCLRS